MWNLSSYSYLCFTDRQLNIKQGSFKLFLAVRIEQAQFQGVRNYGGPLFVYEMNKPEPRSDLMS